MAEEAYVSEGRPIDTQWNQICSQLKMEFGETAFDSWLKPLTVGDFSNGVMNICAPTAFMKNWVVTHYSDRINKIWEQQNPNIKKINFIVQTGFSDRRSVDTSLLKKDIIDTDTAKYLRLQHQQQFVWACCRSQSCK